ncbi:MAG: fimbrillin family protein, partial [Paramuribaculum sp.]|nr:fimbrillin family protein [Paramuribaculum sp.]
MATSRFISNMLPATVICISAALAACSDDFADSLHESGRTVTFDVAANDSFSRSGRGVGQLSTVTLRSGSTQLYLIPEVQATAEGEMKPESRGGQVSKSTIASFGVYAAVSGSDETDYYMDNVEVTKANSWRPASEYLWPGSGSLHLNAYSPYCAAPEGGIVSLPSSNPGDSPVIAYRVPDDVTSQCDLMWSTPKDASISPCLMTFNHALAAVRFIAGDGMTPCTVKSITISGVAQSGNLDIETGRWSDIEGSGEFTATLNTVLSAGDDGNVAEETAITDDEHTFMLLPEDLGDNVSVTIVID